jgi:polyhydroxybutyrate depolymerase
MFAVGAGAEPLEAGNYTRTLQVGGRERSYIVHVPPKYDPKHPSPVVLVLHGAWTNANITVAYSGLSRTADGKNFIAVYPNGTGPRESTLFWNAGDWAKGRLRDPPDDVKFIGAVLDDLGTVATVDAKRVYATGISNGGMMCYKLAADMAERIAAIAPISGTLSFNDPQPKRAVPVLHFHGTEDTLVPFDGPKMAAEKLMGLKSVDDTIRTWVKLDGCPENPKVESLPDKADDGTTVRRFTYGPGKEGSEVILIEIKGGGHTWPGRPMPIELFGRCTRDISANDMLWDFFERHPLP